MVLTTGKAKQISIVFWIQKKKKKEVLKEVRKSLPNKGMYEGKRNQTG